MDRAKCNRRINPDIGRMDEGTRHDRGLDNTIGSALLLHPPQIEVAGFGVEDDADQTDGQ